MKKLSHPNIIRLVEVIDDDENDKLYMVIEYASGGQALEWDTEALRFYCPSEPAKNYTEDEIRDFFRQAFEGLDYLHARGIIHRDIKP